MKRFCNWYIVLCLIDSLVIGYLREISYGNFLFSYLYVII